jgi:pimeloyl-ACP methyl ester carboxylesterase
MDEPSRDRYAGPKNGLGATMEGDRDNRSAAARGTRAERHPLALRSGALEKPFIPRRGYADGPYGQLHYRDTGSGIPLVLCHQAPQTSRQFESVYEPLHRRGIRAIGVDMPGYGESDPTGFVPTVEDWAEVLPALLDALGLDSCSLLGHHTGGLVATQTALLMPSRVQKLIVNGPIPMSESARREALEWVREQEIEAPAGSDGEHLLEAFRVRRDLFGADADPATITRYTIERFQGYAPFWIGHHAAFLYDHAAALERLAVPTLILTNTGDQVYKEALAAAQLRPDFDFVALEGGGIDIVDQQPEPWADAVAAYLSG